MLQVPRAFIHTLIFYISIFFIIYYNILEQNVEMSMDIELLVVSTLSFFVLNSCLVSLMLILYVYVYLYVCFLCALHGILSFSL